MYMYNMSLLQDRLVVIELSILGVAVVQLICKLIGQHKKEEKKQSGDYLFLEV